MRTVGKDSPHLFMNAIQSILEPIGCLAIATGHPSVEINFSETSNYGATLDFTVHSTGL